MILFSSAGCGSGKTYQISKRVLRLAATGERVIVLQPTQGLIDKTVQSLRDGEQPPFIKVFHGGLFPKGVSVAHQLTEYLKKPADGGQIIFATHQVFPYLGFIPNKHTWHLRIDEEIQILNCASHRIPQTHSLLTDHLGLEPHNAIYSRLICADQKAIADIGRNSDEDEILKEKIANLARILSNKFWRSYANTEQYEKLKNRTAKFLTVHSVLQPTLINGFASVFMAAANFHDTAIYRLWSELGANFKEDLDFPRSLRFAEHPNGELCTIHYATEREWSTNLRETSWPNLGGKTSLQLIAEAARAELGASPFIWQANKKEFIENPFGPENVRLPNIPHGLNDFSGTNNIVFLSSLNPTPEHFRFLYSLGMDYRAVRQATYFQTVYQAIMRTSLRDPANTDPKTIIVPDRSAAEYLHQLLPGSTIRKLKCEIPEIAVGKTGRKRKYKSNAEKQAEYRRRKKRDLLQDIARINGGPYTFKTSLGDQDASRRYETAIDIDTHFVTHPPDDKICFNHQPLLATLYRDKYSNYPLAYMREHSPDDFIRILKAFHSEKLSLREDNALISPAIFDPELGEKNRGLDNIVYLTSIWLDIENGDLRPEDVPALFPHTRMVVTNTFNHTAQKPRFRVIIPVRGRLTAPAYVALWDLIARKIEDAGYLVRPAKFQAKIPPQRSGLDYSKRVPNSLFYLPCQANSSGESFFVDCREGREVLDAEVWLENSVIESPIFPESREFSQDESPPINNAKAEAATRVWRSSNNFQGEGNYRFFKYALDLRNAGVSIAEIEERLKHEAKYGRTSSERFAQISSIITSLKRYR